MSFIYSGNSSDISGAIGSELFHLHLNGSAVWDSSLMAVKK